MDGRSYLEEQRTLYVIYKAGHGFFPEEHSYETWIEDFTEDFNKAALFSNLKTAKRTLARRQLHVCICEIFSVNATLLRKRQFEENFSSEENI